MVLLLKMVLEELPLDEAISSSRASTGAGAGASLPPPAKQLPYGGPKSLSGEGKQGEDLPVVARRAAAGGDPTSAFVAATAGDERHVEVEDGVGRRHSGGTQGTGAVEA